MLWNFESSRHCLKKSSSFMKFIFVVLLLVFAIGTIFAQNDLNRMVETEKAFAQMAAEKNTRAAFLEFSAADGIMFSPTAVNAKTLWTGREANSSLLAWTPAFADISSNGVLGYTTGPWELRPKGKDDAPTSFGHFVTLWQKQPDGNFKWVLDIGISHSQVPLTTNWTSPNDAQSTSENRGSAADTSTQFFETAEKIGLEKAYKMFLADDARVYRDGKIPFTNKKNALNEIKKNKQFIRFAKRSFFTSAADLAYISNTYTYFDKSNKETEKGNFVQIWKFKQGRWQIVLDLFSLIPKS